MTASTQISAAVPAAGVDVGNLAVWLEYLAARNGWLKRTAYIEGTQHYTYGEVYNRARRIAEGLREQDIRHGDRVLLALPDGIDFVTTFLAALRIGAVAVPVNTFFHAEELRSAEHIAEAALVVVDPFLRNAFYGRTVTVPELTEHGGPADLDNVPEAVSADAPAFAVFTSGTTGAPRLCFHVHGDALHFDQAIGSVLSLQEGEVCYSVSRMYFSYGLGNSVLLPLQRGAAVVLTPQRADEASALSVLQRHRVGVFYAQPSFYARMLAHPDAARLSRLRLALVAGEMLPRPIEDRLRELLGTRLVNICGTSEIGHAVLADGPQDSHPHSLGRILPPYGLRVIDDAGQPVPDGSVGKLQICGPTIGPGVRRGSAPPLRLGPDEWFTTGDAARVDDGVVRLLGRVDDIEIVAGANVHPTEVEDLITGVAGVREAAVCAVRRDSGVTSLRAYVVAEPDVDSKDELAEAIRSAAEGSLTWYKVPEDVEFVDALPRNATGKILRRKLREVTNDAR
ncbi:class I adenylate-forming enzyme family protein [Nocardia miyunensis]|uniref:class I adenylate-forming enzyme family protein n=1 Tax=Nocardia miyunensis TaxID=282684 RepID=UPI00082CB1C9|nr:AMP-binding protein [Nocardia miyunensis]